VADQDYGQTGPHSGGSHGFHFRGHLAANLLRDFASVENESRHDAELPATSFRY
jgi:hypothetical protein